MATPYSAQFKCFSGCDVSFELTEPVYRCPHCSGLLDVVHDLAALRQHPATWWMSLFDERFGSMDLPHSSGVWGKREWVAPSIDDQSIVSMDEGRSSLLRAKRYGEAVGVNELWLKLCGNSHTGSFKDLGMTVLVSTVNQAIAQGRKIRAIGCASTGDTSAALAAYGAAAGIPVVVLLPRGKVSTAQLVQPLASGARVLALDTDFDGCMAVIDKLAAEGVIYLANSMNSLRIEGQKTVAIEICQQLDWRLPDWVVLPAGNLGNGYATYVGFRMLMELGITKRLPRLLLAQAQHANPLFLAWQAGETKVSAVQAKPTVASAIQIGNPVSAPRALAALRATGGIVEQATEAELCEAAARADRTGLYVCPHTAVALAAMEKHLASGTIKAEDRVVVISTANALKFTEFKVGYHENRVGHVQSRLANQPVQLATDYTEVLRAVEELAAHK